MPFFPDVRVGQSPNHVPQHQPATHRTPFQSISYERFGGLTRVFLVPQALQMAGPFKPSGLSHTKGLDLEIEELFSDRQASRPFRETGTCEKSNHDLPTPLDI
jgi:hypothetical protein